MVDLEKGKMCAETEVFYEDSVKELEKQIFLTNESSKIEDQKFQACSSQLETVNILLTQSTEETKKARKPKWSQLFGSFGAGAIAALALLFLL